MVEGLARDDVRCWAFVENDGDVIARHFDRDMGVVLSFWRLKLRITVDVEEEGRKVCEEGAMR